MSASAVMCKRKKRLLREPRTSLLQPNRQGGRSPEGWPPVAGHSAELAVAPLPTPLADPAQNLAAVLSSADSHTM